MIVWCGAKTGINNNQMTFVVKPAGIINYLAIKRNQHCGESLRARDTKCE